MTRDQIKAAVQRTLGSIAPEADLSQIEPDVALRDQLDIDSMDFLNFAIGLHKELNVEIPEASYPELATLNGCIEYLTSALDVAIEAKERATVQS
jgi:acyl carrier protein